MTKVALSILALYILGNLASCSEVLDVNPSDWKRYDWMREILGEQVVADSATHNIDTGEYRFIYETPLTLDSALTEMDERAAKSGWSVRKTGIQSRVYSRRKIDGVDGNGCIFIYSRKSISGSKFAFRHTLYC